MSTDLLPCPFCGGEARTYDDDDAPSASWGICCDGCDAAVEFFLPKDWNTRADRWIPVEERLPGHVVFEVVQIPGGVGYLDKTGAWRTLTGCAYPGEIVEWEVTHWRSLPPPPEEGA